MKILITGAAGFMGSHLFDYLAAMGHDVYGLDNYSIGTYKHDKIYKIDLLDLSKTEELIKTIRPDLVFHLASWAHEGLSQFCPIKITENNYNAFLNLIVSIIRHKIPKIVVASSMSVYGAQMPPFDENMKTEPEDIYAISKESMEKAVKIFSDIFGFEYTICRPHNVIGPRQCLHDPYRNVAAIFINKMLDKKSFYIYGDGNQKRSFSYIDDVTPYIAKLGLGNFHGEVFNIGPIEEFSINDLANEVLNNFPENKDLKPIYLPPRPLEVKYAWSDNKKAIEFLGYKTSTDFRTGIRKMCDWAKSVGYQKPVYLESLEVENHLVPRTWKEKLI